MGHVLAALEDLALVPVVPAGRRDGDHGEIEPTGVDRRLEHLLGVLVCGEPEIADLAGGLGVLERAVHLLGADHAGVVRGHLVVGVDVTGIEFTQALVQQQGPGRGRPLGGGRVHFVVRTDGRGRLGDQEDLVAMLLGESGEVPLGVAVVAAVAHVVDVDPRFHGDVEQAVVRSSGQRGTAAVDQSTRPEAGAAEGAVGHAGPGFAIDGLLGGIGGRLQVARPEQHLAADADHGEGLEKGTAVRLGLRHRLSPCGSRQPHRLLRAGAYCNAVRWRALQRGPTHAGRRPRGSGRSR